jgi:hypothetical protein
MAKNRSFALEGDSLGRSWVLIDPGKEDGLVDGLLTLVVGTSSQFEVVGNAFVVYASKGRALCMTAAHNFDRVRQVSDPEAVKNYYATAPDLRRGPRVLKTDGCKAIALVGGVPQVCSVDYVSYVEGFDVAVFSAVAESEKFVFPAKFPLDLREPSVGDQVALAGMLLTQDAPETTHVRIGMQRITAQGVVTSVTRDIGRHGLLFTFETTIPVRAGQSGSPVLSRPGPNAPAAVCGIVTADFSTDDAFASFVVPGVSTMSMLWPALGLGFQMAIGSDAPRLTYFEELVRRGYLQNVSPDVGVSADLSGEKLILQYEDKSQTPHVRVLLETQKLPPL